MSRKNNHKLFEYLDSIGILENGTEEEIKLAKKTYRKDYLLKYKQKQRATKPEYTINFSKEKGEHSTITQAAKRHQMTIPAFLKKATLAYIRKTYIVPDKLQIIRLEQILSQYLNEVQAIVGEREKFNWERDQKIQAIEKCIEKLESEIQGIFRQPVPVENFVQKTIEKDPEFKERLLAMLVPSNHDHQNINSEQTEL